MLEPSERIACDGAFLGPAASDGGAIVPNSQGDYAAFMGRDSVANCRRAVACLNACRGIETSQLIYVETEFNDRLTSAANIIARLVIERDEARAATTALSTLTDLSAETRELVQRVLAAAAEQQKSPAQGAAAAT